jgi:hypothetical protein
VVRKVERLSGAVAAVGAGAGGVPPGERSEEAPLDVGAVAAESFRVLRRLAAASISIRPSGPEGASAAASFLLERDRWGAFEAAVAEEARRDFELSFRLTGPWPPYDFVRMQFGR